LACLGALLVIRAIVWFRFTPGEAAVPLSVRGSNSREDELALQARYKRRTEKVDSWRIGDLHPGTDGHSKVGESKAAVRSRPLNETPNLPRYAVMPTVCKCDSQSSISKIVLKRRSLLPAVSTAHSDVVALVAEQPHPTL
jgi:hypothetical protein